MESVNAQTYPNIEIVVVDDNGKGTNQQLETQARVLAFETRPGVELHYVVREKNGGGSLARNTGIDASKADFVAFLDDDDEFLPRKLELQMEPMSDSNVSDAIVHRMLYTTPYGASVASAIRLRSRTPFSCSSF